MEAIRTGQHVVRAEAARWFGDWHPLVRQIAPGEGITTPSASPAPGGRAADTTDQLRKLLEDYKQSVLLPFELPAVKSACEHARRNEMKELVALDQSMASAPWLQPYREDSRTSGRLHLDRLKPLRDQRGLHRYIRAVEAGEANGWHFLVAGAALGLYAFPLRQGLMDYALHTFWNVVGQAAANGTFVGSTTQLVNDLGSDLPDRIQPLIPASGLAALS